MLPDGMTAQSRYKPRNHDHVGARDLAESLVGTLMIVETPIGAPVSVDVTSAGRTQKMDLRTGRTSDLIDGYYPVRSGDVGIQCTVKVTEPGVQVKYTGYNAVGVEVSVFGKLLPYIKGKDWAQPGRNWLYVQVFTTARSADENLEITVDLARDLTLTGPGDSTGSNPTALTHLRWRR